MDERRLQEMHKMIEVLKNMGASDNDIKAMWAAALETADKLIKETK